MTNDKNPISRWTTILSCLVIYSSLSPNTFATPSLVEKLSDGAYVVRDDHGNWGGTTTGITHQRGPDYEAKKILDLSAVPDDVWNRAGEVRLSVYFTVRDYSQIELPQPNGLDEALEIVVNGKPIPVLTGADLPIYNEKGAGGYGFRWHDYPIPKDMLVRGPNEIVFHLLPTEKQRPDDYLYLGIDNTVPTANSQVKFSKTSQWQDDKLTATGGKGEYMVRLYLLSGPRTIQSVWSAKENRLMDPAGVLQYVGAHTGVTRAEWDVEALDPLSPLRVTLEIDGDRAFEFHWLNDQRQPISPPAKAKGPRFTATLPPDRDARPTGIQLAASNSLVRFELEAARDYHPHSAKIDMAPKMAPPQGAVVRRPPTSRIEGETVLLENDNLRCRFQRTEGKLLKLVSLYNELTASEMVRNPEDNGLFLVEVDGKRYTGSREFTCQSIAPAAARQGFTARLACEAAGLEAEMSVWIDDALRMGLKLTNRSDTPVHFKTAFPHFSGLAISDEPADDYYFFPWGGGIMADVPALIRRGYGDHEALFQLIDLFSPAKGGGLAVWCTDDDGRHKVLALRKHIPGRREVSGDKSTPPTTEEFTWTNSLEQIPGIGLTYEYLRRTRASGKAFEVKDVALKAHAGDWRGPMRDYADWCHHVWKFRPYPSKLKSIHNMIAAGWGQSPLFADGKYRTDFVQPRCDCIELMSWWEWSPLGPFGTPFDELEEKIGAAAYQRWKGYFLPDPVTGKKMFSNNPGDYDGYNQRWGGLPALREAIDTYRRMGAMATLYTDPFRADYNTKYGRQWGEKWGVVQADGKQQSHYEAWNPCLDVAGYRQWVAETMGRVMRETGADGIRLDEYGHRGSACFSTLHQHTYAERGTTEWQRAVAESTRLVREAMDQVKPDSVLTTEHPGYDYLLQYLEGCITYDVTVQATELRPLECNLQRFYFPECKAYELDHRGADLKHRKRFWNAVESFGSYYPLAYDRILRENEDVFAARRCEPLIPTAAQYVYANRFQHGEKTIFTLYNATGHTFSGPALPIQLKQDEHVFDLLRSIEVECPPVADGVVVEALLAQDDVGCLVRLPKRLTVARNGDAVRATVTGAASDAQVSLCDANGESLLGKPLAESAEFSLKELPKGAKPVCVKLLADGQLIDIAALPRE
ncbi:MAG: hypothetical protein GXY83_04245 [Rhodopirellula sp.]|nr:hypothetical protein [Rhodopirellula sp.]